jgi:hypothetical protein
MVFKLVAEHRLRFPMEMLLLLWATIYACLYPRPILTLRLPLLECDDPLEQGILAKSLRTSKRALRIREQHSRIPKHNSEEPSGLSRVSPDRMRNSRTGGNG